MSNLHPYIDVYGDLHNHCNISYGHGGLTDALDNALLRLDFVSITGHADWPDMDVNDPRIANIVDFHQKGFAKLRSGWDAYLATMAEFADRIVTYPGYEIHSNEHGDYTIVGRDLDLPMVLADSPDALRAALRNRLAHGFDDGPPVILMPHHIGYRRGARGINWDSFSPDLSPVLEIYSMHGLNDADDSDKAALHSMGPRQSYGTMVHGLDMGKWFGVLGNTDHHSGHPGSYGHGMTGVWAAARDRRSIWQAMYERRTWAMTGDKVKLWFSAFGTPMGASASRGATAPAAPGAAIAVDATAAVDYVELIQNGRRTHLWWELPADETGGAQAGEALVEVELGWGARGRLFRWDVELAVTGALVSEVFSRFRGPEVVSPLDKSGPEIPTHHSWIREQSTERIAFTTHTWGNVTNSTPSTQGLALRVSNPERAEVDFDFGEARLHLSVRDLLRGSVSGNLGPIDTPAYRISAILPARYRRRILVPAGELEEGYAYTRVRLKNGHWAISSPIRIEG